MDSKDVNRFKHMLDATAAGRISKNTQKKFTEVPWKELVGMRNRLIHAYFDIDHDIVWRTIREYLPSFKKQLQEVLADILD